MIKIEVVSNLRHTYSDANFKIRQVQTGNVYIEAYDLLTSQYTYEETNEPIEVEAEEPTE